MVRSPRVRTAWMPSSTRSAPRRTTSPALPTARPLRPMGFCKAPISELATTGFRHLLEMPAYRCRSANEAVGSLSQLTILVHFLHERGNRDFGPCRSSLLYLAGTSPLFYRIAYLLVFFVSLTLIWQGITGLETTNGRTIWATSH